MNDAGAAPSASADVETLRAGAKIIDSIRAWFRARSVLEVHTPTITPAGVTDLHIESMALADGRYLRTSPEYAHKRLLAAGAGDIYELGPVFRAENSYTHRHMTEFTGLGASMAAASVGAIPG